MKFSILVPAYKPHFLAECIESIITQTYQDWELILVNDASPYDIDYIVKLYADKRVRYRKRNICIGAERLVDNWNDCLKDATGDYVICMGDDDKLLPNCLWDYVDLITLYPHKDLYHTRTLIINENSEIMGNQESRPEIESVYSMIWHFWKGRKQWIGDWLFKTTTLRSNGGFYYLPCAWGADNISAFIAATNTGVANNNKIGFSYRVSSLTVSTSQKVTKQKVMAWNKMRDWYKFFLECEPDNEKDKDYWKDLVENLDCYIDHYKMEEIVQNITSDIRNILYWVINRKKYQISWLLLYSSMVQYMKNWVLGIANKFRIL